MGTRLTPNKRRDETNFRAIKKNFLKHYKFPIPLFGHTSDGNQSTTVVPRELYSQYSLDSGISREPWVSDSNVDFIKGVLRDHFQERPKNNDVQLQAELNKIKRILCTEYQPGSPLSPIADIDWESSTHYFMGNYIETEALSEGTIVSSIQRLKNPHAWPNESCSYIRNTRKDISRRERELHFNQLAAAESKPIFSQFSVDSTRTYFGKDLNANDTNADSVAFSSNVCPVIHRECTEQSQLNHPIENQPRTDCTARAKRKMNVSSKVPLKITLRKNRRKETYEVVNCTANYT